MRNIVYHAVVIIVILGILFLLGWIAVLLWAPRPYKGLPTSEYTSSLAAYLFFGIAVTAAVIGVILMFWHYQK